MILSCIVFRLGIGAVFETHQRSETMNQSVGFVAVSLRSGRFDAPQLHHRHRCGIFVVRFGRMRLAKNARNVEVEPECFEVVDVSGYVHANLSVNPRLASSDGDGDDPTFVFGSERGQFDPSVAVCGQAADLSVTLDVAISLNKRDRTFNAAAAERFQDAKRSGERCRRTTFVRLRASA